GLVRVLPAYPRAALAPGAPVRSAGTRRVAVHRGPPGLRALVQGARLRARDGARSDVRARRHRDDPPAAAGPRDRTPARGAGLGARDDVAAGLPGVPQP